MQAAPHNLPFTSLFAWLALTASCHPAPSWRINTEQSLMNMPVMNIWYSYACMHAWSPCKCTKAYYLSGIGVSNSGRS